MFSPLWNMAVVSLWTTFFLLGAVSIRKTVLPGMAIPMLKIRRHNGRLIFNMESPYVDKTVFILRRGPGTFDMWRVITQFFVFSSSHGVSLQRHFRNPKLSLTSIATYFLFRTRLVLKQSVNGDIAFRTSSPLYVGEIRRQKWWVWS